MNKELFKDQMQKIAVNFNFKLNKEQVPKLRLIYDTLIENNVKELELINFANNIMKLTKNEYFKEYGVSLPPIADFLKRVTYKNVCEDKVKHFNLVISFVFKSNKNNPNNFNPWYEQHIDNQLDEKAQKTLNKNGGIVLLNKKASISEENKKNILLKLQKEYQTLLEAKNE